MYVCMYLAPTTLYMVEHRHYPGHRGLLVRLRTARSDGLTCLKRRVDDTENVAENNYRPHHYVKPQPTVLMPTTHEPEIVQTADTSGNFSSDLPAHDTVRRGRDQSKSTQFR